MAEPLVRAGYPRDRAERAAAQVESWAARQEAKGWTPTLEDQAKRLSLATRILVSGREIGAARDELVKAAPVRVATGAVEALGRLRSQGIRLGIVSNVLHETSTGLRDLLADKGLLSLFSSAVFSSDHPWSKPRPEPFGLALRTLRVKPEESVHVGDLLYDVLGAQRAGLCPLLYTGLHRFEPAPLVRLARKVDPSVDRFDRWRLLPERLATGRRDL